MLTDEQLVEQLRRGLAPLRPHADLIDRLREQAGDDEHPGERAPRRLRAAGRRRPQELVGVFALGATVAVSIGIAAVALIFLRHPNSPPARSPSASQVANHPANRAARGGPARGRDRLAAVTAAQVDARLSLLAMPVAPYCLSSTTSVTTFSIAPGMRLVPCRPGQRVEPMHIPGRRALALRERLVDLSFTARRATGLHSWYAWNLSLAPGCGSSTGGPTRGPVGKGARVVFENLLPADCHGTIAATVAYWTQAPNADVERSALVGRTTLRLP